MTPVEPDIANIVSGVLAHGDVAPLVVAGDPVLRVPAGRYDGQLDHDLLTQLVETMKATLHEANGVGLAAVQIGVPLRIAVIEDTADVADAVADARERQPVPFHVLINPTITGRDSSSRTFYEGCLSVPGYTAAVTRNHTITVKWTDIHGETVERDVHGWHARIVQHEVDHLDGRLYLDIAHMRSLSTNDEYAARWNTPTVEATADRLGFGW